MAIERQTEIAMQASAYPGLRQLLSWDFGLAVPITLALLGIGLIFQLPGQFWAGILVAFHGAIALIARYLLRPTRVAPSALITAVNFMILAVVTVVLVPFTMPICHFLLVIALILALPAVSRSQWLVLACAAIVATTAITLVARQPALFPLPPPEIELPLVIISLGVVIFLCCLLMRQYHQRLMRALRDITQSNDTIAAARADLARQVELRTQELQSALEAQREQAQSLSEALTARQRLDALVRELEIPIIPVRADTLVAPLVGIFDHDRADRLIGRVLEQIEQRRAREVLLDVTGVPVIDTSAAQALLRCADATRLLGARTTLVGIRPEVAQALVGLGVDLAQLTTYASLQQGLEASRS